ncbi:hypothetical protein EDD99_5496 [Streptomyces sp. 846.5]|nr:hypothetical protein [Streptomyces sp. 846.5]TDT97367.1 hypothetical protein EDD99_5496 [Streptomyces sp. 846.5]
MATPAAAPTPSHPTPRRSPLGAVAARRRSPLWRRTDTLRSRLRVLLVLALTAAAALSALLALGLYHGDRAAVARYRTTHHQVQAVALANATQKSSAVGGGFTVPVRWTTASGATHQAAAAADSTTVTGDQVTVWLDNTGQVTAPPTGAADSAATAVLLGSLTLTGSGTLILAGNAYTRARLNRTDLHNWDRDWEQTEPTWTRRK